MGEARFHGHQPDLLVSLDKIQKVMARLLTLNRETKLQKGEFSNVTSKLD